MTTRTSLPPLQTSDFTSAFPNSSKVYVEERGVSVPMREIALTSGEALRVYDTSGPQGFDVRAGLPKLREPWIATRRASAMVTQLQFARAGIVTEEMEFVAVREGFDPRLRARRSRARPRNHPGQHQSSRTRADDYRPQLRGQDQRQHRQLRGVVVDRRGSGEAAVVDAVGRRHRHGSIDRQNIHQTREWILRNAPVPIGTVPDLSGARESGRTARRSHVGDLPRHARSSRPSRGSITSPCTPACCCATSR